jgi:hypothetical protein
MDYKIAIGLGSLSYLKYKDNNHDNTELRKWFFILFFFLRRKWFFKTEVQE